MLFNLFQPVLDIVKGAFLSAIVDKDDTHCALVVCLRDSAEAFLASCVPHLKLDSLILHVDGLDLEVDAYDKSS